MHKSYLISLLFVEDTYLLIFSLSMSITHTRILFLKNKKESLLTRPLSQSTTMVDTPIQFSYKYVE